jgi:hypothetical protein
MERQIEATKLITANVGEARIVLRPQYFIR